MVIQDHVDKLPPFNTDAEEGVLGSLLLDPTAKCDLLPEDFYREKHQWVYAACLAASQRDEISVARELARAGRLEAVGGQGFLSELVSRIPTPLHLTWYAGEVKRCSVGRQLIVAGGQIVSVGSQESFEVDKGLATADELLLKLRKDNQTLALITPKDRADMAVERYIERRNLRPGVSTGLIDLDTVLGGGLYGGELILVAARTSMGKTAFLQYLTNFWAGVLSKKVLLCSIEMPSKSLTDRDVAGMTGQPTNVIRSGHFPESPEFARALNDAIASLADLPVYHLDQSPMTTARITQAAHEMRTRYGLDAILVDYLGLLADDEGDNQVQRLGAMTRNLKSLARALDVPVVLAHQLSRAVEQREIERRRPYLSDIRDSGHIEEDSDVVLFLYRQDYYWNETQWRAQYADKPYPLGLVELIIAKQRQGQANVTVEVKWDHRRQTYQNLASSMEYSGQGMGRQS